MRIYQQVIIVLATIYKNTFKIYSTKVMKIISLKQDISIFYYQTERHIKKMNYDLTRIMTWQYLQKNQGHVSNQPPDNLLRFFQV